MPVFTYTALDSTAHKKRGVVRADSAREARQLLFDQGYRATHLNADGQTKTRATTKPGRSSYDRLTALRQRQRVVDTFEHLLTLLESQVTLEEAWGTLMRSAKRQPSILLQLHENVRLGTPMASVMEQHPHHFDAADVALIRAGEEAGELPAALNRFVIRRQMSGKLLATFGGALAYPAFLVFFGSAVVVFLTTRVLPSLTGLLLAAGGQIPWPTRILIGMGHLLTWGILPAVFAGVAVFLLANRWNPTSHQRLLEHILRIPVVGTAWHHWKLAQFCLVLRTLLASGIQLPQALELAGQTTGNGPVARAAHELQTRLLEGQDLDCFETSAMTQMPEKLAGFPPWLWRALSVGQASGDLLTVLERVGRHFELAASKSAARLAAILEPAMILFIGAVVGFIAYGAMLPIIRLGGAW